MISPWKGDPAGAAAHLERVADVVGALDADILAVEEVEDCLNLRALAELLNSRAPGGRPAKGSTRRFSSRVRTRTRARTSGSSPAWTRTGPWSAPRLAPPSPWLVRRVTGPQPQEGTERALRACPSTSGPTSTWGG